MFTPRAVLLLTAATVLSFTVACAGGNASVTAESICAATPDAHPWNVNSRDVVEASGLASSRRDDNFLLAHNDSGDTARIFSIDRQGNHHGTYTLPGATAIDWEDMAIGPGPEEGLDYVYLADIGDNTMQRAEIVVYRVPDPEVSISDTPTSNTFRAVETLTLRYPDRAHDAETLLIDPVTGDLIIVTKELAGGPSFVFRAAAPVDAGTTTTLERVSQIDFSAFESAVQVPPDAPPLVRGLPHLPTGGDVSPDGRLVAIRTYGTIWVWSRDVDMPLWSAFAGLPCEAPSAIEPQGEAIAFDADGRGYTTVSEGGYAPLYHFSAK